jgi:hypothetical protein
MNTVCLFSKQKCLFYHILIDTGWTGIFFAPIRTREFVFITVVFQVFQSKEERVCYGCTHASILLGLSQRR